MIEFFTGWWQYSFMRSAFLAVMIITPLFGILGTMIVNRKMAFFSDALGHSALTGIAVGVVLGVTDTNLSMVIFAIIFALLLNKISSKSTGIHRHDHIGLFILLGRDRTCDPLERRKFQQIFEPVSRGYFKYHAPGDCVSGTDLCGHTGILVFCVQ